MIKTETKIRRKNRTRSKLTGTKDRPRLSVHRSNKFMSVQLIDDQKKVTILGVSESKDLKKTKITKIERSKALGAQVAKLAKSKKITSIVFDKGIYTYHGRVKALADSLREGGIKF